MFFIFDGTPSTAHGQAHERTVWAAVERAKLHAQFMDVFEEVSIVNGTTGTIVYRLGRAITRIGEPDRIWGADDRHGTSWEIPLSQEA